MMASKGSMQMFVIRMNGYCQRQKTTAQRLFRGLSNDSKVRLMSTLDVCYRVPEFLS